MRKRKDDLEKESNNLSIIVVLSLFLICSLGYIAYDKYFSKILDGENVTVSNCETAKETADSNKEITYNKDGYFIKNLMNKFVYKSYIDHNEFALYEKDEVTVEDLPSAYKNNLVHRNLGSKYSFTTNDLAESSKELFGKNIYTTYPDKFEAQCKTYALDSNTYTQAPQEGGCGGSGYRSYDVITKVESDENHIYVYQKVGFQCDGGVCKNVTKTEYSYTGKDIVKTLNNPMDSVNMDELVKDLNEYKFTFTYDTNNNTYYFESVEKVTK